MEIENFLERVEIEQIQEESCFLADHRGPAIAANAFVF